MFGNKEEIMKHLANITRENITELNWGILTHQISHFHAIIYFRTFVISLMSKYFQVRKPSKQDYLQTWNTLSA